MNKPFIKIEIVSDVVCPWCYIGKRRLENALGQLSDRYNFDVSYTPFELNPDMPAEGRDQKAYLVAKFGGEERYQQLTNHVAGVAEQEGIHFDYGKQKRSPNTRDAHRVIWLAGKEGNQPAVKEALMKAYFTDGADLTQRSNLVAIAVACGMNEQRVNAMLQSDDGLAEVILAEQSSVRRGVSGVPFYIVNDKYGISGAQPTASFVEALENIGAEQSASGGETCAVGEDC